MDPAVVKEQIIGSHIALSPSCIIAGRRWSDLSEPSSASSLRTDSWDHLTQGNWIRWILINKCLWKSDKTRLMDQEESVSQPVGYTMFYVIKCQLIYLRAGCPFQRWSHHYGKRRRCCWWSHEDHNDADDDKMDNKNWLVSWWWLLESVATWGRCTWCPQRWYPAEMSEKGRFIPFELPQKLCLCLKSAGKTEQSERWQEGEQRRMLIATRMTMKKMMCKMKRGRGGGGDDEEPWKP